MLKLFIKYLDIANTTFIKISCGETISFGDNSTTICDRKPGTYFAFIMSRHGTILKLYVRYLILIYHSIYHLFVSPMYHLRR